MCGPGERIPLAVRHRRTPSARGWSYALSCVVIRYSPNAPDFATHSARVSVEGSSGIALFATVLGDKNADCHTRPTVRVRGRLTIGYLGEVAKPT